MDMQTLRQRTRGIAVFTPTPFIETQGRYMDNADHRQLATLLERFSQSEILRNTLV